MSAVISMNDLEKRFRSRQGEDHVAVDGFTLEIAPGEFFCLLGPSGCGKSTVLSMVAGFEPPTRGRLAIDGVPITGPGADRAVVFQGDDSLFNWLTARQNVEFGLRVAGMAAAARRERALHFLDLVGLRNQAERYPSELSGGMKQRVQIARVLANEPKIMLMDEPFGALDAQTRLLMQEQLAAIWRRTRISILFITHDIDEAITLGTRIGIMRAGPRASLKATVEVDLDVAQRQRTDPAFVRIYRGVYDLIRDEVLKSVDRGMSSGAAA